MAQRKLFDSDPGTNSLEGNPIPGLLSEDTPTSYRIGKIRPLTSGYMDPITGEIY